MRDQLLHADRRLDEWMDGQGGGTKTVVAFRNFVNVPKILKTRTHQKRKRQALVGIESSSLVLSRM